MSDYNYPGLGLPLRFHPRPQDGCTTYPIAAHSNCYESDSEMIMVRELAMMSIMDRLTDKPDWHTKVFDDTITAKWRDEAMAIPDEEFWKLATHGKRQYWDDEGHLELSDDLGPSNLGPSRVRPLQGLVTAQTFDFCVRELQSKAKYYEKSGLIPTLDACASVVKSNKLVSSDLHEALRKAFDTLKADQQSSPDWHPNSSDMVLDLVHPSMYPLVYGRSRVLKDEVVGVSDAVDTWAGKGDIIPKDDWVYDHTRDRFSYIIGSSHVPPHYWSNTYQWLPANVAFQDDGSVKFTSYINNLHPNKRSEVYRTIEKLVEAALPAWDQCLAFAHGYENKEGAGRLTPRIPPPENPDDENPENWDPNNAEAVKDVPVDWETVGWWHQFDPKYDDEMEEKWKYLRKPVIPEPEFEDVDYAPLEGKRLVEKHRDSGLQVIVKMASIELTPEKPEFPLGGWHVEGQMNEHICATALYYLDSENITDSSLCFRMQTSAYMNDHDLLQVGQDSYHCLEQLYGTELGGGCSPALQNYGSVETCQGRLLAFPNVFQHRVSSFRLKDPTKPGHRRFIALWLVDPTLRIISTANVPPQRMDWWAASVFGDTPESRSAAMAKLPPELVALLKQGGAEAEIAAGSATLPPELLHMVREHLYANDDMLPMGEEEARQHRLKLMEERSVHVKASEKGWQLATYNFCEH
ncbi:hypothetical protein DM02DRAFT_676153 [Periconia macrospinosa]|uniref:Uncharacterized protein n=1 Tax=Periconia macrospinosa TaxID=97972 RepID=A0A2V1DAD1_9PLEO|nr:hypothetical protein DM02DRAFT_676153 [Periconia macrospinosa]